jgi:hypothetical protein
MSLGTTIPPDVASELLRLTTYRSPSLARDRAYQIREQVKADHGIAVAFAVDEFIRTEIGHRPTEDDLIAAAKRISNRERDRS